MAGSRPPTPEPIKRALRQEACFGCCKCGNPIFVYHHIVEYSDEQHFRAEDMMILCPNHHAEATAHVLTEVEQRAFKNEAFNCSRGLAHGPLWMKQKNTSVSLGGHTFNVGAGNLITVGGDPLLSTKLSANGILLLGLKLYDEEDHLVAEIVDNEWFSWDPLPWDIEFKYQTLRIRSALRKIDLIVDCSQVPVEITGELWRKGRLLRIDKKGLHVDQAHLLGAGQINGFVIEMDAATAGTTGLSLIPGTRVDQHVRHAPVKNETKIRRNELCSCGSGKKYKRCHGRMA